MDAAQHGDDWLDREAGDDLILCMGGADRICGGDGNDRLAGDGPGLPAFAQGNDTLDGGAGDDELQADGGDDPMDGGEGGKRITEVAGNGIDTVVSDVPRNAVAVALGADLLSVTVRLIDTGETVEITADTVEVLRFTDATVAATAIPVVIEGGEGGRHRRWVRNAVGPRFVPRAPGLRIRYGAESTRCGLHGNVLDAPGCLGPFPNPATYAFRQIDRRNIPGG